MLKRQYRLRKNRSFRYVYRRGRTAATALVSLAYVRTGPPDGLLIGFAVGKKVGKSVVRNRVKRRMREACRSLLPRIRRGYWLVFSARTPAAEADFARIRADMANLLSRAKLLTGEDPP